MVETPDPGNDVFAEMADDDLKFREAIKDTVRSQAENMRGDTGGELEWSRQ